MTIEKRRERNPLLIKIGGAKECFGGEFIFDKMNPIDKFIVIKGI